MQTKGNGLVRTVRSTGSLRGLHPQREDAIETFDRAHQGRSFQYEDQRRSVQTS